MSSVSHIQFELPPEVKRKDTGLWKLDESKVFVGCPIWGNKDWKGIVFPEKTPAKDYLKYYSEKFSAIELNSTFYHLPPIETLKKWREQTPSSFLFCPKIPQDISHTARFTENTDLIVESLRVFSLFEEQLGHVFLQLPPGFERSQFSLLKKFLTLWKQELPLAIEFRHPSWF